MTLKKLLNTGAAYNTSAFLYGFGFLMIATVIALCVVYFKIESVGDGLLHSETFSQHLISYANLLLLGSTVLYVGHLWASARMVGQLASIMATLGAMGITVALLSSWLDSVCLHRTAYTLFSGLYDVTALFSAITVVVYLAMEKVYGTRSAGAFVMPIVAGVVLFESFLLTGEQAVPGHLAPALKTYWMHAHILAVSIGFGAFAVAASLGCMYLVKARSLGRAAAPILPSLEHIDRLMLESVVLGFSTFTLGTILGISWSVEESGKLLIGMRKEAGSLIIWLAYLAYFYAHRGPQWHGKHMAWLAIIGFCFSVLCLAALNVYLPEHAA
jgi:ABC-type transport system involved in cytochrome c biogenesis permease subunit